MLKIGITGGIGSGKSTVAKVFQNLGAPVYDSDSAAKWLMSNSEKLRGQLQDSFGPDVFSNQELNRAYLAGIVFNNKSKLQELNALVHPAVAEHFSNWCQQQAKQSAPYILKEAALLIESGAYKELDHLILISADLEERISRVIKRDGSTRAQVEKRVKAQLSDQERRRFADIVLENNNTALLIPQILELHQGFSKQK